MTESDRQALKEVLRGFVFVCGIIALFFVFAYFLSEKPPNEKFKIVDRYDNRCDVIRYSPGNTATYKYFIVCSK